MKTNRLSFAVTASIALALVAGPAVAVAGRASVSRPPRSAQMSAADWRQVGDLLESPTSAAQAVPSLSKQAYMKASNTGASDFLGGSVAVSGDTVVVGATGEDSSATGVIGNEADNSASNAGAAFVFTRSGTSWSQQAYLKPSNTEADDAFGISVAIDADTIVVGAPGEDSSATGVNGNQNDNSASVAGAAYVFTRSGGTWRQQAYLKASVSGASDNFGAKVAISGDTVVVSAPNEDSGATGVNGNASDNSVLNAGAGYVFTRSGGIWSQQAYLKASNPDVQDFFGWSVAVSGDTVVVGAQREASSATGVNGNESDDSVSAAGAAYVFTHTAGTWSQQAYLKASNTGFGDFFGISVAISGDTIVVGAHGEASSATGVNGNESDNSLSFAGAAYVFTRSSGDWSQEAYLKASNTESDQLFGQSVAISGDTIVVGAPWEDGGSTGVNGDDSDNTAPDSGVAYAFARTAANWSQHAYVKASNTTTGDSFADSVSISGDTIVAGATGEDSSATGTNGDGSNDSASNAGAAYVYGPPCSSPPFSDVPTDHPFCTEIEWMSQTGISTGFDDGTYRPAVNVTRQAMSAFLARFDSAMLSECESPPFSDVPVTHPFCREIEWMADEDISTGFDDGTYRPSADVTRQAMSAFLARLAGVTSPTCTSPPFNDVPVDHPFCTEVKWMKDTGISSGFEDGTYRPTLAVTRQAMSAFLYRLRVLPGP